MKYFTPDLLIRYGSPDVEVAEGAFKDWERRQATYLTKLDAIREKLPKKLQSLLKNFYLHDAKVVGAFTSKKTFFIVLQLDAQRDRFLVVRYKLAGKPRFFEHSSAAEKTPPLEWLYDEIHVQKAKPSPVFRQSILFTGGRELRLAFRDLDWDTYRRVLSPRGVVSVPEVIGESVLSSE